MERLKQGDYITISNIPGYGQKQDNDLLQGYTVGKAIENIDRENVTDTIKYNGREYKVYLIRCIYTSG